MTPERLMKILVTGGTGFIGQAVLRELLQRGHQVVATARRFSDNLPVDANLEWVLWDGAKQALPIVQWSQFQAILHLAAGTYYVRLSTPQGSTHGHTTADAKSPGVNDNAGG